jgi:hypothetical protein
MQFWPGLAWCLDFRGGGWDPERFAFDKIAQQFDQPNGRGMTGA